MINQLTIIGNVSAAPRVKTFDSGKKVARLQVAVNQYSSGEQKADPLWLDCELWDGMADRLVKCAIEKGRQIAIVGSLAPNNYSEQIGDATVTHRRVKVKVYNFQLTGKKPEQHGEDDYPTEPETSLAVAETAG